MGKGIPVLYDVAGESAEIVMWEKVGLAFESDTARELLKTINTLRGSPDILRNAGRTLLQWLSVTTAEPWAGMLQVLRSLAARRRRWVRAGGNRMTLRSTHQFTGSGSERKRPLATESSYGNMDSVRVFTALSAPALTQTDTKQGLWRLYSRPNQVANNLPCH
jgi:hypothetical protein